MRNHNHYGYDSDVEQMADSPYNNDPRSHERALVRRMRIHFCSPYANPNTVKPKTTSTNSFQWNLECQDRFFKVVQQLGGIDRASPAAVLALMNNNDDLHRLDLNMIAHQMHFHRTIFKKVEAGLSNGYQQENHNEKVKIQWNKNRFRRFVNVIMGLGGVNKVSPQAILEAMIKDDINDSFCLTVDEIADRLYYLREGSLKEGGYGPVRRSMSLVRSGPYGQGLVGPKTGSTSNGVEFAWTLDRHKRFVNAVEMLGGVERARSWAILEVMKEEGLTREIVFRHLQGLRQLLGGTEIEPISVPSLFNVYGTNGNGSNNSAMPAGDQAKVASSWSNSSSFEDVLNNFGELNLKPR